MRRAVTRSELRATLEGARSVVLVPTMGMLHEGHLSLVDRARELGDTVVASIFVNPLQFGPGEDLARYPRQVERDAELAAERGVDVLFTPEVDDMYPAGDALVRVTPGPLAEELCGRFRPGHFEGVLTVVAKLFNIVRPDAAVFGQKDFQQAALVRRMVADLDFGVRIDVAPIVREPDGLALSSRNIYLDGAERARATALRRALAAAEAAFAGGERDARTLVDLARGVLEAEPGVEPQYVQAVAPETLRPVEAAEPGTVLALAAHVGDTRLIDNIVLG